MPKELRALTLRDTRDPTKPSLEEDSPTGGFQDFVRSGIAPLGFTFLLGLGIGERFAGSESVSGLRVARLYGLERFWAFCRFREEWVGRGAGGFSSGTLVRNHRPCYS